MGRVYIIEIDGISDWNRRIRIFETLFKAASLGFHSMNSTVFDDKNSSNRFFLLDLLRFLACVAVVFWHYQHFFYTKPGTFVRGFSKTAQPFYQFFHFFYHNGYHGVPLFWALSGFVFFALFSPKIFSKELSAKTFFMDRFSRLYPLHLLSLLAVACIVYMVKSATGNFGIYPNNGLRYFITNLFLVPYVLPRTGWSFNAPVWSMSLEIIAYILFYFYARFLKADIIKTVILAGIFGFLFQYPTRPILNPQIFRCCLFFFSGGALFLLLRKLSERVGVGYTYIALSVIFLGVFFFYRPLLLIILFLILLFSYPAQLPKKLASFFFFLGNVTYGVYMLHIPLQLSMIYFCKKVLHFNLYERAGSPVCFILFTVLLFVISAFSYQFFEYPAKKWLRKRFSGSHRPEKSPQRAHGSH